MAAVSLPIAQTLCTEKPPSVSRRAMLCICPFTEKSSGVAPRMLTAFFFFSCAGRTKRSAYSRSACPAPETYEPMPLEGTKKDGTPDRLSISRAMAARSQPVIIGIGVPARAMKRGESSFAARTVSSISFSSSPSTASSSESPEMKTSASMSYQRGSSWVL